MQIFYQLCDNISSISKCSVFFISATFYKKSHLLVNKSLKTRLYLTVFVFSRHTAPVCLFYKKRYFMHRQPPPLIDGEVSENDGFELTAEMVHPHDVCELVHVVVLFATLAPS